MTRPIWMYVLCLLVFVCPFCFIVTGCAQNEVKPLDIDSNASILEYHKPVVPVGNTNYALNELMRGLLFFDLGDYLDSDVRFANACSVMEQITGDKGRETAAVVLDERAKTYKGEPYERATAYFYRGLCRYRLGDYSGALAAFRHSLACDGETRTDKQEELEDFSVSQFMAAFCYERLGERANAQTALNIARKYSLDNQYLTPSSLAKNFVAVVGVGEGPYFIAGGFSGRKITSPECPEVKVELFLDDELLGNADEIMDLLVQAKSQKWGEADTARVARVIGKAMLEAVTGVRIREQADIRCWWGLPRKFFIITADVPPGTHTVMLKCYDKKGNHLVQHGQVWFDVPIQAEGSNVFYFRTGRYRQNIYGMELRNINEVLNQ